MRCNKKYDGKTCNSCMQCGAPMSAGETVCANCRADEKTLISSPFLKCPNCMQKQWSFNFSVDAFAIVIIFCGIVSLIFGIIVKIFFKNSGLDVYFVRGIIGGIATFGAALVYSLARSIKPHRIWWLIWQPVLGIILALLGIFFLSKAIFFIGVILAVTWYFSQRCHLKVFELNAKKNATTTQRVLFESKMKPNIPEDVKKFKTLSNSEEALVWKLHKLFSGRWLFRFLGFTAVILVLVLMGPGEFLWRDTFVGSIISQTNRVKESVNSVVSEVQLDLGNAGDEKYLTDKFLEDGKSRREIYRDLPVAMKIYMWKIATGVKKHDRYPQVKEDLPVISELVKQDLEIEQIYRFAQEVHRSISEIRDASNSTESNKLLKGDKLLARLRKDFAPMKDTESKIFVVSPYFQKLRSHAWIIGFVLLILLVVSDFVFIIFMIVSSSAHKIYTMSGKVGNNLQYAWAKVVEKQQEKKAYAQGREYAPCPENVALWDKIKNKDLTKLDVVIIFILMKAFFAIIRMDHFK